MIGALAGVVTRPRAVFAELARRPRWAPAWLVLLTLWAVCGGWLLSTPVGRQALVDERVRAVESFGGTVTDAEYAALQADPPWWVYFTSGGRLLLTPGITLVVALALWAAARLDGAAATWSWALAVAVHASVVLLIGQIVATPLHYVRESLTSPLNAASVLPLMEDGTVPARFFGVLDLFAVWWGGVLAVGLSVRTGRRPLRYVVPIALLFVAFAAGLAAIGAVMRGGS